MALPLAALAIGLKTLGPLVIRYGGQFLSGGSALMVAVVTAIPAGISAVGSFLKAVGESPLLAFLFGAALLAPAGFMYGISFDAPMRAKIERRAIDAANARADIALARQRTEYERQLAAARARIAQLEQPKKPKR